MDLKTVVWNKENYEKFRDYLLSMQDIEYQVFMKKLVTTKKEIIGIRMNILRKLAKDIRKGDYLGFLRVLQRDYYEEVNIEGLVIASLDDNLLEYLDDFVLRIDNWAICDSFCSSCKVISKEKDKYLRKVEEYVKSSREFVIRVGLVLLLNYYVEEGYLDKIIELVNGIDNDSYYVKMASAWLIAECFIKYPLLMEEYVKNNGLSVFVHNKIISKISDSYRVSKEVKDRLKKYRK